MNNIFITGGTGFLGSMLIEEILNSSDDNIYALVRAKNTEEAGNRLISILEDTIAPDKLDKEKLRRIHVICGDIADKDLGLKNDCIHELAERINIIYNSAAITNLNLPLDEIRKVNVNGTKNVLDFAVLCKKTGRLKKVNHISTAYVVGTKVCTFKEDDLDVGQQFNNTYEQSKFEAEKLVLEYRKKELDIDVFRPSIILGRYKDGRTTNFKMLYQPLHFFSLELVEKIPVIKGSKAHLINVDIAAKAIYTINTTTDNTNMNYHVVSTENPDFSSIIDIVSEYFGFKKPEVVPIEQIDMDKAYSPVVRRMLEPYVPYFNCLITFEMTNSLKQLERSKFGFPKFDEKNIMQLCKFCDTSGFIERKTKSAVTE